MIGSVLFAYLLVSYKISINDLNRVDCLYVQMMEDDSV